MAETLLGTLSHKRVAVLGLAFKKDTDDIREAASLRVIEGLRKKGAQVVVYDPMAIPNTKRLLGHSVEYAEGPKSALRGTDCCIIMTEWDEFRKLRPNDYRQLMRDPSIVDARRLCNPSDLNQLNYVAIGVGRTRA
jgi:UDP-glucose 6-dehydrogenase